MRRTAVNVALVAMIGLMSAPGALAGGGAALIQPDKTGGPAVNVSVIMDATAPSDGFPIPGTARQFAVRVQKSGYSQAAMFEGTLTYRFGCQQPAFATLEASTEERFMGFMNGWIPPDALSALIGTLGAPDKAAIVDIDNVRCTTVAGGGAYLSFTGMLQFGK